MNIVECPFCGEKAEAFDANEYWYVGCLSCDAEGPPSDQRGKAVEYWNFRPHLSQPRTEGELPTHSRQVMNPPADEAEAGNLANTAPRQPDHDGACRGETGTSSWPEARPVTATAQSPQPPAGEIGDVIEGIRIVANDLRYVGFASHLARLDRAIAALTRQQTVQGNTLPDCGCEQFCRKETKRRELGAFNCRLLGGQP
jgi:hypothetical protein